MSRSLACTSHLWPPGHARHGTGQSSRTLAGRLADHALGRGTRLTLGPARAGRLVGPGADGALGDVVTGPMFPEDSWVQVRYPLTSEQKNADRAVWPWLPGWVAARCGLDEWEICVQAPDLATWHEGEAWYPVCFRDASEIRQPEPQPDLDRPAVPELEAQ